MNPDRTGGGPAALALPETAGSAFAVVELAPDVTLEEVRAATGTPVVAS